MNILSFLNRYLLQKNIYFSHYNKNNFSSLSFKYNILTVCIRNLECVIILIIIFQIRIQLTSKIFHSTHVFQLIITIVMISLILITILFLFKKEINDNLFNTDLCNTNNILYYNNKTKKDSNKDTQIKFISKKEILDKNSIKNIKLIYRKVAYYKHFKSIFAKYIKDKANKLKNICFPHYNKNNFSALSYKYTGNPKEADNFKFLSFKVKDIITMGKDIKIKNRQYNNELLIRYIEENKELTKDKEAYIELINFLNNSVEEEITIFYSDKLEYVNLVNDVKCRVFDKHFKSETGISLLDRNGFIQVLKK